MSIKVSCPQCSKNLNAPDAAAGKRIKCPGCATVIPVPGTSIKTQANGAAAQQRRSAVKMPMVQGDPSQVTSPRTFKKLFNIWVFCAVSSVFFVFLAVVLIFLVGASFITDLIGMNTQSGQDAIVKELEETGTTKFETSTPWYAYLIPVCGILYILLGFISGLAALILIAKEWGLIQDGTPRLSPAGAVIFLLLFVFLPMFFAYWVVLAFYGLAVDLNKYADERGLEVRRASEGMMMGGLVYTIFFFPLGMLLFLLGFNSIKNTCVDIATAKGGV